MRRCGDNSPLRPRTYIYTSQAFNIQFDNTTIVRTMSSAAKPTDNPIIESFNGWMKNELEHDFKFKNKEDI